MSPYAVTKYVNELYADVFARSYGFAIIGLRYFNVFGPRQGHHGAYAAVIPKWTVVLLKGKPVFINGDGETSRDFTDVANAVQANLRAANASLEARNQVYNVAVGDRTTLNQLLEPLREMLVACGVVYGKPPILREFREGGREALAGGHEQGGFAAWLPAHPRHLSRHLQRHALVRFLYPPPPWMKCSSS